MFVNWNDPQALWLNLTNLALGLATLAAVGVFLYGVVGDLAVLRKRSKAAHPAGEELRRFAGAGSPAHLMPVDGLGLTMADGGEPVEPKQDEKKDAGK
jgi:hypothetical protein